MNAYKSSLYYCGVLFFFCLFVSLKLFSNKKFKKVIFYIRSYKFFYTLSFYLMLILPLSHWDLEYTQLVLDLDILHLPFPLPGMLLLSLFTWCPYITEIQVSVLMLFSERGLPGSAVCSFFYTYD